ncbi:O-methyltransferase-domain-containing protein [Scenedesmus sp. NREL 46B-D3]|nr:O-methyltransferase-domain-containing protein [Scenedesmus sp. NREL 46B-D3]
MLGSMQQPENSYIASSNSPAYQRYQELARVAGISRAFTLSVKLGLYTLLRDAKEKEGLPGLSSQQVAQRLGLQRSAGFRGVTDWLDVLASLHNLRRGGSGADALYSNSADAEQYLSSQSPDYMGGHAVLYHDRTFPQLLFMEHSLKTGVQPAAARSLVAPVTDTFAGAAGASGAAGGGDPAAFALGMTGCNKPAFKSLASQFDWGRYRSLGDFGGSAGVLCCCVAAAQPHMACTTHDLPAVHDAAVQYVQQQGLADQVKVLDVDFFDDSSFPSYDVITMGMILHDWGLEKKKLLMKKVLIDDARQANLWGLMMSLDMLLEFEGENSFDYSFNEFTTWAAEVGFSSTQLIRLTGPNSAAVAYK